MIIRHTLMEDLEKVMEIYNNARQYMRDHNNSTQWINGYPCSNLIIKDINNKSSYVCADNNQIVGVFRFAIEVDSTYLRIFEGNWLNAESYGVVHRIASAKMNKGIATYSLNWCFEQTNNLRIDTHRDNVIMQKLLEKNGFIKCGIIYVEDGSERIAYHKFR